MPLDHQDRHFNQLACGQTSASNPKFLEPIIKFGFHFREGRNMLKFSIGCKVYFGALWPLRPRRAASGLKRKSHSPAFSGRNQDLKFGDGTKKFFETVSAFAAVGVR